MHAHRISANPDADLPHGAPGLPVSETGGSAGPGSNESLPRDADERFIVEKLSKIDGVGHIQSKVVLSTIKKEMSLPMTEDMVDNSRR